MNPRLPIRRFDVFAEYNRLRALKRGMDNAHAKGYGLWVAKVVASGGGRRAVGQEPHHPGGEAGSAADQHPTAAIWHELGGTPQTDILFDKEIVQRMGADFYRDVFAPAIAEAFAQGKSYESIRDTIRREWGVARQA